MTVVSKFSLSHIFKAVAWLAVTCMLTYGIFYYDEVPGAQNRFKFRYFEATTDQLFLMILINIALAVFFYIFIWEHSQIVVNEENIMYTDLISRRKKRIKYEEIFEIGTHLYYIDIKLRNGKTTYINSDVYSNIKDIHLALLVNLDKFQLQKK